MFGRLNRFHRLEFLVLTGIAVIPLLMPDPADATIQRQPVEVRLEGPPRAAEPGKPFHAVLLVEAAADVTVEDLFIDTGSSRRLSRPAIPGSLNLVKGEIRRIPFTVTTDDPALPLQVEYQVGSLVMRKAVDLSPAAVEAAKPRLLVTIEDRAVIENLAGSADPSAPRAEEGPVDERLELEITAPDAESKDRSLAPAAYNVRVVGFFTYRRMNDNIAVGVDGAVARVYDEDSSWDELLASQVLGPDGRFDMTFNWDPCFGCDGTPDLYVEFELENAEIDVHDDTIWESDYTFQTGVWQDYGGTFLDVGVQTPGNASLIPACHIMTNATRAWRFAADNGRDTPKVGYQWPDNDGCGACYDDGLEEVYIDNGRQWNENTILHEFGHHFVNTWATTVTPDYCNGFCDTGSCGHCIWCRETDHDAFSEGFPHYYQDVVMRGFPIPPVTPPRTYETLMSCDGTNFHDPLRTEGYFAALLRDIDDAFADNELTESKGRDELNLGFDEIFWTVDFHAPTTPQAFMDRFQQEYPGLKEFFWATAANNGYQTDTAPPGKVTNLTSDHPLNQNWSTNPNIKWFWDRAPDDASGVAAYSVWVQQGILPGMPDATAEIQNVTQFQSGPHPPGWYYISIRAMDRNGTWSDTYETYGPVGIRAADPANLTVKIHSNWDFLGVTARHVPDATEFDTSAPSYLDGTGGTSYLSAIYNNSGEVATSVDQYWVSLFVDGYPRAFHHRVTALPPGSYDYVLNKPLVISGGRHTIGVRLDDLDFMSEPNEVDNYWARQWSWDPAWLGLGPPAFINSPPVPYAGTEWIVDGSAFYGNCAGFRAQDEVQNLPNTMWTAVTLHATDNADYDLDVYIPTTSPTAGFSSPQYVDGSYRISQCTDTFLFNSWQFFGSPIPLDYGITNYSGGVPGANGFIIQKVTSWSLSFPGSMVDILDSNEMLKLYQYQSSGGNVMARVQVTDPSLGQVYLTLVPQAFRYGSLLNAGTLALSDPVTGEAVINEPQAGVQCLAVWRDPSMGTGPLEVTVTIQATPADLAIVTPPGWAAPLVPRPANDGAPGGVPMPAFLVGDAAQTWINYAITNGGPMVPPNPIIETVLYADGLFFTFDNPPAPAPGATTHRNLQTAFTFRGGRHVLGVHVDALDQVNEMTNANNWTAGQWVWRPSAPPFDLTQIRPAPPERFGGWDRMPPGAPLWFNLDGVRTQASSPDGFGNGWKVAALVMPDAGKDVDLKLFEAAPDAVSGFDVELTSSSWGIDQVDFVLADFRMTTPRVFDVGLLKPVVEPGSSLMQFRLSKNLGLGPAAAGTVEPAAFTGSARPAGTSGGGIHGPFTIGAGDLFDLYETDLPAGTYQVRLVPGTGSVDWGIGLYGPGSAFVSKSETIPGGMSWEAPAGSEELLTVTIVEAGLHGIVVWKNVRSQVNTSGTFTLHITQQTSAVPDMAAPPAGRLIAAVRPNPFRESSDIEFELTRPEPVEMHVFDLHGRHVRGKVLGRKESGRHAVSWDGEDDSGRQVPVGMYFVRIVAGSAVEEKKIVRVR